MAQGSSSGSRDATTNRAVTSTSTMAVHTWCTYLCAFTTWSAATAPAAVQRVHGCTAVCVVGPCKLLTPCHNFDTIATMKHQPPPLLPTDRPARQARTQQRADAGRRAAGHIVGIQVGAGQGAQPASQQEDGGHAEGRARQAGCLQVPAKGPQARHVEQQLQGGRRQRQMYVQRQVYVLGADEMRLGRGSGVEQRRMPCMASPNGQPTTAELCKAAQQQQQQQQS